jgi:DNA (cytosine-5)-methyltransferase 1
MKHLGLFEGIGGFALAVHWMGWHTKAWVEINPFCQKVLQKNFPNAQGYGDIKEFDGRIWRGKIGILTGGFPCQPFSLAGKRKGTKDERHLWKEMLRVIREVQPTWVVGENVYGILSMDNGATFEEICTDLEGEGYAVQAFIIPACSKGAPHRRDRVWIVAQHPNYATHGRSEAKRDNRLNGNVSTTISVRTTADHAKPTNGRYNAESEERQAKEFGEGISSSSFANAECIGQSRQREHREQMRTESHQKRQTNFSFDDNQFKRSWQEVASEFCRVDDGVSKGLDKNRRKRLEALGNAIVPQIAYEIFNFFNL